MIIRGCLPGGTRHGTGVSIQGQILYEMHVGTFTPEGTWESAARELPELATLGVTVLELMPVAEFSGSFGWGYDGVDLLLRRIFTDGLTIFADSWTKPIRWEWV